MTIINSFITNRVLFFFFPFFCGETLCTIFWFKWISIFFLKKKRISVLPLKSYLYHLNFFPNLNASHNSIIYVFLLKWIVNCILKVWDVWILHSKVSEFKFYFLKFWSVWILTPKVWICLDFKSWILKLRDVKSNYT